MKDLSTLLKAVSLLAVLNISPVFGQSHLSHEPAHESEHEDHDEHGHGGHEEQAETFIWKDCRQCL